MYEIFLWDFWTSEGKLLTLEVHTSVNHLKSHPLPLEGKVKKAQSKVQKKKSKNSEDRFLVLLLSLEILSEVGQ